MLAADLKDLHFAEKTSQSALGQPACSLGRSMGGGRAEEPVTDLPPFVWVVE